jgi:hypothetical protein
VPRFPFLGSTGRAPPQPPSRDSHARRVDAELRREQSRPVNGTAEPRGSACAITTSRSIPSSPLRGRFRLAVGARSLYATDAVRFHPHVVAASARHYSAANERDRSFAAQPQTVGALTSSCLSASRMRCGAPSSPVDSVMMTGGFLCSVQDGTGAVRQRYGIRFYDGRSTQSVEHRA